MDWAFKIIAILETLKGEYQTTCSNGGKDMKNWDDSLNRNTWHL